MTTIFQLLNNKVEIFFPLPLPLLPPHPHHGAESRSQDTSLAYKRRRKKKTYKPLYFPEVTTGLRRGTEVSPRQVSGKGRGGGQVAQSYILREKLWILAQQP